MVFIKRLLIILLMISALFYGCSNQSSDIDSALALRQKLMTCDKCSFKMGVTADYGDAVYEFQLNCVTDENGGIQFEVTAPTSISGITGSLSSTGGKIQFDNEVLSFPVLTEGELSPISTPWVFYNGLCNGYLSSCGNTKDGKQIIIDDTLAEDPVQVLIWTDHENTPKYCEILWQGRCILSATIENFVLQ